MDHARIERVLSLSSRPKGLTNLDYLTGASDDIPNKNPIFA
jgi:hypothetical protein